MKTLILILTLILPSLSFAHSLEWVKVQRAELLIERKKQVSAMEKSNAENRDSIKINLQRIDRQLKAIADIEKAIKAGTHK